MMAAATSPMQADIIPAKRGRGAPAKPWTEHRGVIRGAKNSTIERYRHACEDSGRNMANDLDETIIRRVQELEDPAIVEIALDDEERRLLRQVEDVRRRRDAVRQRRSDQQRFTQESQEYQDALAEEIQRFRGRDLKARFEEVADDVAKDLAQRYPGVHWQTVKQALRKAVTGRGAS